MINFEDVIAPPKRILSVDWRELWRYRDLFLVLAWRDIAIRYKQTALGFTWAILQPLVMIFVFTFIFNRVGKIPSQPDTPYPIFVCVGQLLWLYYSNTLTHAANSLVQNAQMVQKIYFPRLILPATAATTGLVDLAISSLILVVMLFYYDLRPEWISIAVVPVLLVCAVLTALGFGLLFAAINVKYRDVRHALPFLIQSLLFVTPVFYPTGMLDGHPIAKNLMLWLNPITGIITNARAVIIGKTPVDWYMFVVSLIMSIVIFAIGLYYFKSTEHYFADIV